MVLDRSWIEKLRADLPELPYQRRERLVQLVGLIPEMATILTAEKAVADFFEAALEVAPQSVPAEKLANWMSGEFFSLLNQSGLEIDACRVTPQALAQVVDLVESGVINAASGKAVLAAVFSQGGDPQAIVEARGLAQINDSQQIRRMIETILQSNPEQVGQYLDGKVNLSQWFFGQVMQAARGKADPQIVQAELDAALKALDEHPQQT
jgi:aspartyl-tRNA(Asn)/glutamyl-tRNA(Gln) amidotransferase subunit B